MAEDSDPLSDAVQAALARADAQRDEAEQLRRQRLAIWRMGHETWPGHEEKMSAADVTLVLRQALLDKGLTPKEVDQRGVGYHSVQKIIKGDRPQG